MSGIERHIKARERFSWGVNEPAEDPRAGYAVRLFPEGTVVRVFDSPNEARRECERLNGKYVSACTAQPVPVEAHDALDAAIAADADEWHPGDVVTLAALENAEEQSSMIPVLVTTEHRGVFFGYVDAYPEAIGESRELRLTDARNCVAWSTEERGVFGLAVMGPGSRCRVGPKVPELIVNAITSVCRVTPEAAERWEAGPWNG